jgi:hypothetical protein
VATATTDEKYKSQYKYITKNKEQYAAYSLKYYYANKEKCALRAKKWREKNKDYIKEKQKLEKRKRKLGAIEYLGGKCGKCGESFHPSVYEFHHRDPVNKDRDPSKMMQLSISKLYAELDKCDLLCANCHRLIHNGENY